MKKLRVPQAEKIEQIRQAASLTYESGLTAAEVAKKLGVTQRTVYRHLEAFKLLRNPRRIERLKEKKRQNISVGIRTRNLENYKESLKEKAVDAIKDGLDDPGDPYKRANIGVQVMKGIGEFTPDTGPVGIQLLMDRCPPEWRSEFGLAPNDQGQIQDAEIIESDSALPSATDLEQAKEAAQ